MRCPTGLNTAGQNLWRNITAEFDLEYEPHKVELLKHACRVSDTIAELDKAAKREPLTAKGSTGQLVIHPLIGEVRAQRALLAGMLDRLKFEQADD